MDRAVWAIHRFAQMRMSIRTLNPANSWLRNRDYKASRGCGVGQGPCRLPYYRPYRRSFLPANTAQDHALEAYPHTACILHSWPPPRHITSPPNQLQSLIGSLQPVVPKRDGAVVNINVSDRLLTISPWIFAPNQVRPDVESLALLPDPVSVITTVDHDAMAQHLESIERLMDAFVRLIGVVVVDGVVTNPPQ